VTDTTPTTTRPASRPPDEAARWAEVRRVADLLDSRFRIPGTRQTFGVDAILGVVPGIGDIAGLVASSLVVGQAARLGARGWTLVRMLLTMTLDAVVGSIPFAGTVFDVVYKANNRNVRLLEQHVHDAATTRRDARRSVLRSLAAVVAATVIAALLVVAVLVWLLRTLF
jgi:hypothetical protein